MSYGMAGGGVSCSGSLLEVFAKDRVVQIKKGWTLQAIASRKLYVQNAAMESNIVW